MSEKGLNSTIKNLTEKKKIWVNKFFISNAYIKFQNPSIYDSKDMRGLESLMYKQTDKWKNTNQYTLPTSLKLGHPNTYCLAGLLPAEPGYVLPLQTV